MQKIKFLVNNIKNDLGNELTLENIVLDIKSMGECKSQSLNFGEYSLIDPDEMLVNCRVQMEIESYVYDILIHIQTYETGDSESVNTLEVTITTDIANEIYGVKVNVKDILKKYYKEIYILIDTHNQSLCSELYYQIHRVENKFREAINSYMVRKYGVAWFKQNIKDEFQSKSKQYASWYNQNYEDFRDIESEVFNLQTDDLIKMLEKSYIDQLDKSQVDEITKLKDKLNDKAGLVFKNQYLDLQSIWDTDIKDMLPHDFKDSWKEFTNMRNMIAHNKPICMKLKQDIKEKVNELEKVLDDFKNRIDIKLTSFEKQKGKLIEIDINDDFCCEEAGIEKLPDRDDVIDEIFQHDDIQELYSDVDEFISDYRNVIDELEGWIEEISDNIFDTYNIDEFGEIALNLYDMLNKLGVVVDQSKIKIISKVMSEKIRDIIIEDLIYLFSMIEIDVKNIVYSNSFDDNITVFEYKNIFQEKVEVKTSGDVFTEKGSGNIISIILLFEGEEEEYGRITKEYGDYEMNDEQGYAMPIVDDSLEVDIKGLSCKLNNHFEETLDLIKNLNNYLSALVDVD